MKYRALAVGLFNDGMIMKDCARKKIDDHRPRRIKSIPSRGAFTLVELLVVIGIIALLIAILLPALNRARRAASTVSCASNMRQLSLAVLMYADTNGGRLPWNYYDSGNGLQVWHGIIHLITSGVLPAQKDSAGVYHPGVLTCPDAITDDVSNIGNVPAIFRNGVSLMVLTQFGCDFRQRDFNSAGLRVWTTYNLNGSHPAYCPGDTNATFPGSPHQLTNYDFTRVLNAQLKIAKVHKSSDTWLVFENSNCDLVPGDIVFRHPNLSANYAYFDAHVETLSTRQVDGWAYVGAYTGVGIDPRTDMIR
jgi:prepilin-type N-terminal cleavage/methylation domain-containing protein/prepilin-type processing-associated H-X9-DG protein